MNAIQQLLTDHIDVWTAADTEKKTRRGRSSGNTNNVYGIKKLRELILELAVRGKLVPQNSSDEPTCELIKRIEVEKSKLCSKGKIKKEKPLPPISEKDGQSYLPKTWVRVRFGSLVNISTGKHDANAATNDGAYPFFTCSQTPLKISTYSYDTGAVLLAGNGDFNIKVYKGKFDAYQRTYVIEPLCWDLNFCFILIAAQIKIITENNRGSAIPYLKIGDLTNPVFGLPPIQEQHRIVAKVDELMALCDQLETQHTDAAEAHEKLVSHLLGTLTQSQDASDFSANWHRIAAHFDTLFTTEASIDALKQTLLQLAVMGKLVPQDSNDEPASELLKRIQIQMVQLSKEGKMKRSKVSALIENAEKPYELLHGWKWVRLGQICQANTGYAFKSSDYRSNGTLVLRVTNINPDGTLDLTDAKYIDPIEADSTYRKFLLSEDDVLLVMVGGSLGKLGVVEKSCLPAVLNQNLWKMDRFGDIAIDYFLFGLRQINTSQIEVTHSTHGHLAQGEYLSKLFPLPPLAEQHRIVAKVDALMVLCNQLKSCFTAANHLQQKLADVIVGQAVG